MKLNSILEDVEYLDIFGELDIEFEKIEFDSRKVSAGDIYCAAKGTQVDGHKFISGAIEKGAVAVVCEVRPVRLESHVTYIVVRNTRLALGKMSNIFFGKPSEKMILVGVTGTNGKTTTATLLYELFSRLGFKCGLLSTIRNIVDEKIIDSTHTTGDAIQITSLMKQMVDANCTHCFMEVTSHAIDQHRISGLKFDGAIFTNLSRDHLDYHKTMEIYRDTKKNFFDSLPVSSFSVINADDAAGTHMVLDTKSQVTSFGKDTKSNYDFSLSFKNKLEPVIQIDRQSIQSPMIGEFNAYNIVSAYLVSKFLNVPSDKSISVIEGLSAPEGRMQTMYASDGRVGIVDFAHTPDALEKVLSSIRKTLPTNSKILTVVGCGGDRDQGKRPLMAKIATELSNLVVITSDNPRGEDPDKIIDDMLKGLDSDLSQKVKTLSDRRAAIQLAASLAENEDVILVAGKGHEKFQLVGNEKIPFDDVNILKSALDL